MKVLLLLVLAGMVMSNDFDLLDQMTQFEFGKTIIATLQIELEAGDSSIDNVVNQLRSIQITAQQDLEDNTKTLRTRIEQCNQREFELNEVINSASSRKADDERAVPLRQEELNAKLQQLNDKTGQESRNLDRISLLESQRKEEKQSYESKKDQNVGLIEGLKKAKSIISQLKSSFLQTDDVKEVLKKHVDSLAVGPYTGLIQMLVQSAEKDSAQKIVQIIDELVESINHLSSVESTGEEEKIALYQRQKARYQQENKSLEATLATLKADTQRIQQTLLELSNDIDTKNQVLSVKNTELNDWKKTCDDEVKNHQFVRTQKNSELGIINECIEIFTSRFNSGIRSYVQKLQI
ncbi:hypothetical protein pb186bvf_002482 [Paramecium bursaria]